MISPEPFTDLYTVLNTPSVCTDCIPHSTDDIPHSTEHASKYWTCFKVLNMLHSTAVHRRSPGCKRVCSIKIGTLFLRDVILTVGFLCFLYSLQGSIRGDTVLMYLLTARFTGRRFHYGLKSVFFRKTNRHFHEIGVRGFRRLVFLQRQAWHFAVGSPHSESLAPKRGARLTVEVLL